MHAIIQTGGKQYRVAAGDVVEVEVAAGMEPDSAVRFDQVLLIGNDDGAKVGTPFLADALVEGTVLRLGLAPKVVIFKKKRRKQYRRTRGHRQPMAEVRIDAFVLPGGQRHERPAEAAGRRGTTGKSRAARRSEGKDATASAAKSAGARGTGKSAAKSRGGKSTAAPGGARKSRSARPAPARRPAPAGSSGKSDKKRGR